MNYLGIDFWAKCLIAQYPIQKLEFHEKSLKKIFQFCQSHVNTNIMKKNKIKTVGSKKK